MLFSCCCRKPVRAEPVHYSNPNPVVVTSVFANVSVTEDDRISGVTEPRPSDSPSVSDERLSDTHFVKMEGIIEERDILIEFEDKSPENEIVPDERLSDTHFVKMGMIAEGMVEERMETEDKSPENEIVPVQGDSPVVMLNFPVEEETLSDVTNPSPVTPNQVLSLLLPGNLLEEDVRVQEELEIDSVETDKVFIDI